MENSICITGIKRRPGDRGGRSDTDPGRTDRTCDHLQITAYQSGADNIRKDYQRKFRNLSVVSTEKKEMTTGYVRGEVTVYLTLTFILLGIYLGVWGLLEVLATSFFILGILALGCVTLRRKKSLAFPFYPFLTVGYLFGVCIGGL